MDKVAMTPDHERWKEFVERLEGPEGCHFRPHPTEKDENTWDCTAGPDHTHARKLLKEMDVDVERSIELFRCYGGYCDCEILFNVQAGWEGDPKGKRRANVEVA
jgi:hypothetical protein